MGYFVSLKKNRLNTVLSNQFFMKKSVLFLALFGMAMTSQAQSKSEVKLNILNTITRASVEVGYEYFTSPSSSVTFEFLINDRFSYYAENDRKKFNTNSIQLGYNFYFDDGQGTYVYPFLKYRFGDFEEEIESVKVITDMNSFMLGLGIGYEWVWNNQFAFGPYANIARNFSEEVNERFSAVEVNAGISVGYRF